MYKIKIILILTCCIIFSGFLFAQEGPYNLGVSASSYDMVTDSSDNIYLMWITGTNTVNVGRIVSNALTDVDSFATSWTIHTRFARPRLAVKLDGSEIHTCFISTNLSTLAHVWRDSSENWHEEAVWTYNSDGWYIAFPAIGVDAQGYVHIIGQRWKSGQGSYIPYWRKTTSWSGPTYIQIPSGTEQYRDISLNTDQDGGIHAAWKSISTLGKYRYAASGGNLANSSTIDIPNLSGTPTVNDHVVFGETCKTDTGNVHHVYIHMTDLTFRHVIKPVGSGAFNSPIFVATVDNNADYYEEPWPSVGTAQDGRIFTTWAETKSATSPRYVMLAEYNSGSWTSSIVTDQATIGATGRPVLVVVGNDTYIVWRSNTGVLMLSTEASGGSTPSITVQYPSGGEEFAIGGTIPISWTSSGITGDVKIALRKSDDSSGYVITNAVPYNSSPFNYLIPVTIPAGDYMIKIKNDTLTDYSNIFKIVPAGSVPTITVTSPNGGESYAAGSQVTLTWTWTGTINNVRIEFSANNGSDWSTLFSSVPNTGSYTGTIPSETPPSSNCLVRISDASDGSPSDTCNNVFTITAAVSDTITVTYPNGFETITAGSTVNFTWTSTGSIANIRIELSTNNGSNWSTLFSSVPNTGNYSGLIPSGTTPSAICLVRMADASDGSPVDTSNSVFTITSGGSGDTIRVTQPNGGEAERAGTLQTITWTSSGDIANVKIEFSPDNGTNWGILFNSVPNTGSYTGLIPADTPPSDFCLIRISDIVDGSPVDISDNTFSILPALPINIIYPAGGENYVRGIDSIPITWTTSGITGYVKIALRKSDDSSGFLINTVLYNNSPYNYPIPSTIPVGSYIIKIKQDPFSDYSNVFTISEPGAVDSITVLSPDGGEAKRAGDPITINWTSVGSIPNIRIELSTNNGGIWFELVNSTPNTGTYTCILPPDTTSSSTGLIRISDASDGSPFDLSNSVFTILPQLPISITNPIGGEIYTRGVSSIPISWTTSGLTGYVKIALRKGDDSGGYIIIESIPFDAENYNYFIPASIPTGTYFIKIKQDLIFDSSLTFTIK